MKNSQNAALLVLATFALGGCQGDGSGYADDAATAHPDGAAPHGDGAVTGGDGTVTPTDATTGPTADATTAPVGDATTTIPDGPLPDLGLPSICLASPAGGAAFTDGSVEWGFHGGDLDLEGGRLSAGDLDGDGYPDLIVHKGYSNVAPDPAGPPMYYVLMNRPKDDGTGRHFVVATDESGYDRTLAGLHGRVAHFALFGDVDNDGDTDIISGVSTDATADSGARTAVMLNDGHAHFTHAPLSALQPGRANPPANNAATLLDYNRDGFLDLFVGNGYGEFGNLGSTQQDRLYHGAGDGRFEDDTEAQGITTQSPLKNGDLDIDSLNQGLCHKPTYGVANCDLDGDGDPDLLTVSYGRQQNMLWVNRGDHFENQSTSSHFAMDDNLDYSDNQFYRCHCALTHECQAPAAAIQCSSDNWSVGIDDQPFRLAGNTFSVTCADVDDDGKPDVLTGAIKHWHIGNSSDASTLLHNDSTPDHVVLTRGDNEALGLKRDWGIPDWNEGDIFSAIFDFDLDGRKDLYWGSTDYPGTRAFLYHQKADGTFVEVAQRAGIDLQRAAGLALADVDRDGDLDMIVGTSTARCTAGDNPPCPWVGQGNDVYLFINDAASKNNWVAIDLDAGPPDAGGLHANRLGIGARVAVTAGGRTQYYEVQAGHGHFGQQDDITLHVGLGETCAIDKIEVRWPDSTLTTTTYTGVRANTFVKLSGDGTFAETHVPGASP